MLAPPVTCSQCTFSICIVTFRRPKLLKRCLDSLPSQLVKFDPCQYQVIVSDDCPARSSHDVVLESGFATWVQGPNRGVAANRNNAVNASNGDWIIYLDDDDSLYDKDCLLKLSKQIENDDTIVFWRVQFPNRLVPSDTNFGNAPVMKDVSGIGFTFPNKYKTDWEPFKRGDYRIAKELYNKIPKKVFYNNIITKLQRDVEDGFGLRDDKSNNVKPQTPNIPIPQPTPPPHEPVKITKTLEKTQKQINYEKVNQIFNNSKTGQQTVIRQLQHNNQPNKKLNSSNSKMFTKKKLR